MHLFQASDPHDLVRNSSTLKMTYAEVLMRKGKRGAAAFVQVMLDLS